MKSKSSQTASHSVADKMEPTLFFGGIEQGWHISSLHFAILGETGSGKSATIRMLLHDLLQRFNEGALRLIVFDPKCEFVPILAGLAPAAQIDILHVSDSRAKGWDIAADVKTRRAAEAVANILCRPNPHAKDPFFANAARILMKAVMCHFIQTVPAGKTWSFRDVMNALRDPDVLRMVLMQTPAGRRIVKLYFGVHTTLLNVMSTVANETDSYVEVAAAWDSAPLLSVREWVKGPESRILVLGHDEEAEPTSKAVNQVMFDRLRQAILSPPHVEGEEIWLVLDELALGEFPAKSLMRLADMGRGLGCRLVLASQGIDGLYDVYGDKKTNEILNQCVNRAFLRSSSRTADYASQFLGKYEAMETQYSTTTGSDGKTSHGEVEQRVTREAVLPSEFQILAVANRFRGFDGYYAGELGAWYSHISAEEMESRMGKVARSVPSFLPRTNEPELRPWDEADCRRLGLPLELISLSSEESELEQTEGKVEEPPPRTLKPKLHAAQLLESHDNTPKRLKNIRTKKQIDQSDQPTPRGVGAKKPARTQQREV